MGSWRSSWSAVALVGCATAAPHPKPVPSPPPTAPTGSVAMPEPEAHAPAACPEAWQQARAWTFSGDGALFAVAQPGRVDFYETGSWRRRFSLPVTWYAESLQLSEDGRWLYVWFWPPPEQVPALLAVIDTKSGVELGRREAGEHDVERGFISAPDGSWVAVVARTTGLEPAHVELVSLPDFAIRSIDAEGPWKDPKRPKWSPRKLPTGSGLPNGDADWSLDGVDGLDPPRPRALRASEDSSRLIVEWIGDQSPRTSVVDAHSGRTLARLRGGDPHLSGEWLSLFRPSGATLLWDFRAARGHLFYDPLCTPLADRGAPLFRSDGTAVALPGHSVSCLVETATGKLSGTLPKHLPLPGHENDYLVPEHWTSDGQAVISRSGTRLWMTRADGERLELPGAPLAAANALGESRVHRRARDRSLFWFGETGFPALEWRASLTRELVVPEGPRSPTVVSDDGELFVRTREQPLTLRSTRDSTVRATLVGDELLFLGFDPTGRWVVTSTPDHELTVWDVAKSHAELGVPGCMGESDE